MNVELNCSLRNEFGSNACNRIRNRDKIPGVIYGRHLTNYPLEIDKREIEGILRNYGSNALVNVNINGTKYPAMIKEVQRDSVDQNILHIDLQQVNAAEKIHTSVPIMITGKATLSNDAILQQQIQRLDIECYPYDIPKSVSVNIADLALGSNLKVGDVEFGEEITVLNDDNEIILSLSQFKEENIEEEDEDYITADPLISESYIQDVQQPKLVGEEEEE
ncbi:50S ribosomal protein L25 [Caldisalinibacter kiritimatiensis]|uniref:Large ribosomal subunit protein bL25 n=1 Tax=Caldisalinibacter kiritimatiensis TaxID=1304284 RepID=R1CVB5_9FIRM|nr:50S ribosomal protein L25 [Caldisalinibacter kiritimatiensis]EOD00579.1 LSU ribosomal protein L25p [Caldisalinibacter kiritimatiensis]